MRAANLSLPPRGVKPQGPLPLGDMGAPGGPSCLRVTSRPPAQTRHPSRFLAPINQFHPHIYISFKRVSFQEADGAQWLTATTVNFAAGTSGFESLSCELVQDFYLSTWISFSEN